MGLHLLLVQRQGMSEPPGVVARRARTGEPRRSMPFVPNFALRDAVGWCAALGVLAALAAIMPWELGEKADPFLPAPAGIRPEWFFCWMFQLLKMLPGHVLGIEGELIGIFGIGAAALLWLLVPFLDPPTEKPTWISRGFTVIGWVAVGLITILTVQAYLPGSGG
jgi:quinol-cytochrome oxidoreductase complex cytochrome b subunit